jgi:hypothetical protein
VTDSFALADESINSAHESYAKNTTLEPTPPMLNINNEVNWSCCDSVVLDVVVSCSRENINSAHESYAKNTTLEPTPPMLNINNEVNWSCCDSVVLDVIVSCSREKDK